MLLFASWSREGIRLIEGQLEDMRGCATCTLGYELDTVDRICLQMQVVVVVVLDIVLVLGLTRPDSTQEGWQEVKAAAAYQVAHPC